MKRNDDEEYEYDYEEDEEDRNVSKNKNEYTNIPGDDFEVKASVYEEEPTEEIVRNEEGKEERIQHRVKDIKVDKQIKKPIINKTSRINEMNDSQLEDVDEDNYTRKTIRSDGEIFGDEDY
ncbi:hypothetical protein D3C72_1655130 [compost metagenome]